MKHILQRILSNNHFFTSKSSSNNIKYVLKPPSQILITNIYINWLRYINLKTQKIMPIHLNRTPDDLNKIDIKQLPFGMIKHKEMKYDFILDNDLKSSPKTTDLEFKLIIPKDKLMQYFIQWQRYRKYWWSSITTTPSLFTIGDIQQTECESEVDIVAQHASGSYTVECLKIWSKDDKFDGNACLTCTVSLERALIILLMDGLSNEKYLRLHRKMAPYKMSFGLDFQDVKNKETLKELATLLFHQLKLERISAHLPDFSISLEDQIQENLDMGIPYTAILNESTLENGIFHLMNSSTMLKEQLHVADFQPYVALVCANR